VIAPASLLENWERELALWCPKLKVMTYHGANKDTMRTSMEAWRQEVARLLAAGKLTVPPPGFIMPGQEMTGGECSDSSGGWVPLGK
jgi:hypothetical protein